MSLPVVSQSANIISESVELTKKLNQDPDNHFAKRRILEVMKELKVFAVQGDKIAQHALAQLYPQNSKAYLKWMHASAEQGFTNAMLMLARYYVKNGKTTDIQQAAQYVIRILASGDSYIGDEAKALMKDKDNRLLNAEVNRQLAGGKVDRATFGLFSPENNLEEQEKTVLQQSQIPSV